MFKTRWLETLPGPIIGVHEIIEKLAAANIPQYAIMEGIAKAIPWYIDNIK